MDLVKKFVENASKKGFYLLAAQIRKGSKVVDEWTRFPAKPRFETYSFSRTFTGLGAGIALQEGLITLDEKIIDSFPEATYDIVSDNVANITVRDLLTMSCGLKETMLWHDSDERKKSAIGFVSYLKTAVLMINPELFFYTTMSIHIFWVVLSKRSQGRI